MLVEGCAEWWQRGGREGKRCRVFGERNRKEDEKGFDDTRTERRRQRGRCENSMASKPLGKVCLH